MHYNFSLSDRHFSLIFLEGEVNFPKCQGPAWTLWLTGIFHLEIKQLES